jgi:hypothetical protein
MGQYIITTTVEEARRSTVEKKLREAFGTEAPLSSVEQVKTPESRADRFAEAESLAGEACSIVEELKDEMEQWYDSIPENLQGGDKASEVESTKDALENYLDWSVAGLF